MALQSGIKLGQYRVLSPLGAGAMGEVYLARDTRLDRDVAIKVLPEAMTRDPERVARFEREAKLSASLNHANIAAIHGFDDSGGTSFFVMEYVEGETLAQRLARGPFPMEEALDVARQIAEALEAAHEKGVIHRDLKPGNVMIRADGAVKVLDFGLARALTDGSTSDGARPDSATMTVQSPAVAQDFTEPGAVLGTAAYMSPEQARGRPLDRRTDIWSFGLILFECLTGKTLFRGETASDSMAAVLHKEPDWTLLPTDPPPTIQHLLRRCLTKDPKKRLHDIADARVELEDAISDPSGSGLGLSPVSFEGARSSFAARVPWAVAATAVFAAIAVIVSNPPPSPDAAPGHPSGGTAQRLLISLPDGATLDFEQDLMLGGFGPSVAISPDGSKVAFAAKKDGRSQLWVRGMDSFEVTPLSGTEGGYAPFFSPDSKSLAFFTRQGLHVKPRVSQSSALFLCPAPASVGGTWLSNNSILLATSFGSKLQRVDARGGAVPQPMERPHPKEGTGPVSMLVVGWPQTLGGKDGACLFSDKWSGIGCADLDGENQVTWLVPAPGRMARYVPSGHIVFASQGQLFAVAFDHETRETRGDPVLVLDGVRTGGEFRLGHFDVSRNGTLVYVAGTSSSLGKLVWVDRTGKEEDVLTRGGEPGRDPARSAVSQDGVSRGTVSRGTGAEGVLDYFDSVQLSPDGKRLAVIIWTTQSLWLHDLSASGPGRRLASAVEWPLWSYDSRSVLACPPRQRDKLLASFTRYDLHGASSLFLQQEGFVRVDSWSADGQYVLLSDLANPDTGMDILLLDTAAGGEPRVLFESAADEWMPRFSPDARWIAYASAQSGLASEIYVREFPDGDRGYLVSAGGGEDPMWSGDGTEVFYRRDNEMWAVKVSFEPEFKSEEPVMLFSGAYLQTAGRSHDFDPRKERFLLVKQVEQQTTEAAVRVILNFDEELKRLVPNDTDSAGDPGL